MENEPLGMIPSVYIDLDEARCPGCDGGLDYHTSCFDYNPLDPADAEWLNADVWCPDVSKCGWAGTVGTLAMIALGEALWVPDPLEGADE